MPFAYSKLHGLPADRLFAAIEPMLAAHGLEGVELIWKTDNRGWVLYVTVERASHAAGSEPDAGVTLDQCSELSRDLSAALDVDDLIPGAYRLEVGTPGIERRLYSTADFQRFTSKLVKLKLHKPHAGEYTFRGYIAGVESGAQPDSPSIIVIAKNSADRAEDAWRFDFDNINTASLVLEWGNESRPKGAKLGSKGVNNKKNVSPALAENVNGELRAARFDAGADAPALEENDYSDALSTDELGEDSEFDRAAAVATTQVKHGS